MCRYYLYIFIIICWYDAYAQDKCYTQIPKNSKSYSKITSLDLSNQRLSQVPKELMLLRNLEYLYLDNNAFEEFSPVILECINLKCLNLKNNKLNALPDLSALNNLERLCLVGNNILASDLIYALARLKKLRVVIIPKIAMQDLSILKIMVPINCKVVVDTGDGWEVFEEKFEW